MDVALILSGLILFIIIWLTLDFSLGRRKHLSTASQKETPMLHSDFKIFTHGKELFSDFFKEIQNAQGHVHVLFYIVKDDGISRKFFTLLKEKAREGVEVRLILDRIGSIKVSSRAIKELRDAGVQFAFSDRVRLPYLFYSAQVRNHRKISIIDGKIGYLGGYNIGKEYIDEDPALSPWRDYHLKMTGEGVNFLQSEFLIDWRRCTGVPLHQENRLFPELAKGPVRHQLIPTEAGQLETAFLGLLDKAKQEIFIGTPYFIPCKKILALLLRMLGQGVRVTILVPGTADHPLVQEASFRYLRPLLKAGASVYQYKNGFYHAKTLVIDDKICDIGTANFDNRSLFLNKEMNCMIYDSAFIKEFKQNVLEHDLRASKPLTLRALNRPNLFRSIKEGIAGLISHFL